MGWIEDKRAREKVRDYGIGWVASKVKDEEKAKRIQNDEETKNRREIQEYIFKKVLQGYPADQLLNRMNFVFSGSKYQPYKKYFATWIKSAMETANKHHRSKENDEEER